MTGKTLHINGTDYTALFTRTGYSVTYKKRRGRNSGDMMDGSHTDDVLAIKAVVTGTCIPLNEEQLSDILSKTLNTYVTVRFFDPQLNAYREAEMIPSEPSQKHRGAGSNGLDYWTGTVLTFEER